MLAAFILVVSSIFSRTTLIGSSFAALYYGLHFFTYSEQEAITWQFLYQLNIEFLFTQTEYLLCFIICNILLILQLLAVIYKESGLKINLLNFFTATMCCIISANNTFTFYIGVEIAGLLSTIFVFLEYLSNLRQTKVQSPHCLINKLKDCFCNKLKYSNIPKNFVPNNINAVSNAYLRNTKVKNVSYVQGINIKGINSINGISIENNNCSYHIENNNCSYHRDNNKICAIFGKYLLNINSDNRTPNQNYLYANILNMINEESLKELNLTTCVSSNYPYNNSLLGNSNNTNYLYDFKLIKKDALKIFIYNQFASLLLLIGICLLHNQSHTFTFEAQSEVAAWLIFASCLCKSAQLPFSIWLLHTTSANILASILIHSATVIGIGVIGIVKFSYLFTFPTINFFMIGLGFITGLIFSILSLYQTDVKKIIACLTISAGGIMFICCGFQTYNTGINYFAYHALYKSLLFSLYMYYIKVFRSRNINDIHTFQKIKYLNKIVFTAVFLVSLISDLQLPKLALCVSCAMHFVLLKMFLKIESKNKQTTYKCSECALYVIYAFSIILIVYFIVYFIYISQSMLYYFPPHICAFILVFICAYYLPFGSFKPIPLKKTRIQNIFIKIDKYLLSAMHSLNIFIEKIYINLMVRYPYKISAILYIPHSKLSFTINTTKAYVILILISLFMLVIYAYCI